ncbi:MAG TPA: hypothetical protein VG122_03780 [Gemmata sp.]|jgi:hypothetical protein|nr:hypothetical protein [Gemmata sp.]
MAEMESESPEPPKPNPSSGTPGGPKGKKSDQVTVSQRVEEVLQLRIEGRLFQEIVRYGSAKGWGVSERQIQKYIKKSDDLLVERLDKKRKPHIAQRQALYALALSIAANSSDCRAALAILDSEAKLRGLFPDTKEVKDLVKLAQSLGMKVEELERRLANAARTAESESQPNVPETGTPGPDHPGPAGGPPGSVPG